MKIVVLNDSHYEASSVNVIKKYLVDVDVTLHCGDGVPGTEMLLNDFNGEVYAVKGNCNISNGYPIEGMIDIMRLKIYIIHGHMYNVKNEYNTTSCKGKEVSADTVLFGYSHKVLINEYDGLTITNPGSITLPYGRTKKALGFIEILENKKNNIYLKEVE